jgi:hypothetical protein
MKKIYLIIILTISSFTLTAQPSDSIDWQTVINDYYTKYQPQKSPAWLFPLIFEEGTGQRDTIYLGFDDEASNSLRAGADSLFSEKWITIDSLEFHAAFSINTVDNNEILKVAISKANGGYGVNNEIKFVNGVTPLIVHWDKSLFYHDSLSLFIFDTLNHGIVPYLYGNMGIPDYETYDNLCNWNYYPILGDTVPWNAYYCIREDSITLKSAFTSLSVPLSPIASFAVNPWRYLISDTEQQVPNQLNLKVYPNPTNELVFIKLEENSFFDLKLYNLLGQQVDFKTNQLQSTTLNLSSFPKGIYFLIIQTKESRTKTIKIVKE